MRKTHFNTTPLLSAGLCAAQILFGAVWLTDGLARGAEGPILRGMVTANGAIPAGSIQLYDGVDLVQSVPQESFYNGTFAIPLNSSATAAIASGDLRIKVQATEPSTAQPVTLEADLQGFDPALDVAFVNPVTTIVSDYMDLHPSVSETQANSVVGQALGVGSCCSSTHSDDFDNQAFLSDSVMHGGIDAYAEQIAGEADAAVQTTNPNISYGVIVAAAAPPTAANALAVTNAINVRAAAASAYLPDFLGLFQNLATALAGKAFADIPFSDVVSGWIINEIFNGGPKPPDQVELKLKQLAQQQEEILAGISNLSEQIADVEKRITDQVKLAAYQAQAQDVQKSINDLVNMENQLIQLANLDPQEDNSIFIKALQTRILNSAPLDLENIWSGLEGNGGLVPGLINRWSGLETQFGAPAYIAADPKYVSSAWTNWQYYQGAQVIGLNLQIELAHALQFSGSPSLGKQIINTAFANYNKHLDTELKLLAHNQKTVGTNLYLVRFFPEAFFTVAGASTNSYSIDTRTGLLWVRTRGRADSYSRTVAEIRNFQYWMDKKLAATGVSYKITLRVASRADWTGLLMGTAKIAPRNARVGEWLKANGFGLGVSMENNDLVWTSDVSQGSEYYAINLRDFTFEGEPKFISTNRADWVVADSDSLLADPDRFFYKSGQYAVTPAGN